jgi:hypothetical protein
MFNSTLTRRTPMKRSAFKRKPGKPMKRTAIKRAGKKTNEWERVRGLMKAEFKRAGITVCEIAGRGCWRDNGLGFAHSLKRRNIPNGSPLLEEAVLACNVCHDVIEGFKEGAMATLVRALIAQRPVEVASVF